MESEILVQLKSFLSAIIAFLPTLIKAIIFLLIGLWITRMIDKWLRRYFERKDYDISLEGFIRNMVNIALKVIVIVSAASIVGFPTASLFAIFGAAGLAVGLALQGSLANFAGGVLILIFKPFRVGDLISAQGETGFVQVIQIFNTILLTPENKTVILPNGAVSNGTIINISRHGNLRVDLKVSVDFREDVGKVRTLILDKLMSNPKVLKNPAPSVNVLEYAESAIVLAVRPYATPDDFWDVYFNSYEEIRSALIDNGIKAPQIKRLVVQS